MVILIFIVIMEEQISAYAFHRRQSLPSDALGTSRISRQPIPPWRDVRAAQVTRLHEAYQAASVHDRVRSNNLDAGGHSWIFGGIAASDAVRSAAPRHTTTGSGASQRLLAFCSVFNSANSLADGGIPGSRQRFV